MTDQERRRMQPQTCWSCEGVGLQYKSSNGRAYREPCPVCNGTGQIKVTKHPANKDLKPPEAGRRDTDSV